MLKKIIVSFFLALVVLSCKNNDHQNNSVEIIKTDSLNDNNKSNKNLSHGENDVQNNKSFTLDCGSGCALTYDEVSRNSNKNSIEIKYKVTQYINEKIEEEYYETYIFESDNSGKLSVIHLNTNKENISNDDNSLIKDELLKIGNTIYNETISVKTESSNVEFVKGDKPYRLMIVPFDLKEYIKNLPNEIKNNYSPTNKMIDYLISIGYEGESYKCYFLKFYDKSTDFIVSISRNDSEYFLLIKTIDSKILSYKEIGSIGGNEIKYFKIDKDYKVINDK